MFPIAGFAGPVTRMAVGVSIFIVPSRTGTNAGCIYSKIAKDNLMFGVTKINTICSKDMGKFFGPTK